MASAFLWLALATAVHEAVEERSDDDNIAVQP
jgi:hypothetical protein